MMMLALNISLGQESFSKRYTVASQYGDIILKSENTISFSELSKKEQDSIRSVYPLGSVANITDNVTVNNVDKTVVRQVVVDLAFYNTISVKKIKPAEEEEVKMAMVKFEDDKIYVNPWLKKVEKQEKVKENGKIKVTKKEENKDTIPDVYFLQLKNRNSVSISFSEWNFSALIIPFKFRWQADQDFSADVNVNMFACRSWGKSLFLHRKKVDNKTNSWKISAGLIAGSSTVKLNASNTSKAETPVVTEITQGLATLGGGVTYAYNKVNFGVFYGFDYALGKNAEKWNFNKKPWLGFALGYSIFTFN